MFLAHKAAMDPRGPQPCEWDHYPAKPVRPAPPNDVPFGETAGKDGSAHEHKLILYGPKD